MENMLVIRKSTLEENVARLKQNALLREACRRAIESAEAEGVDRYRGTDEPREFITILRDALEKASVQ